jgi:2-aminoadipate transaminase
MHLGHPEESLFPAALIRRAANTVLVERKATSLQYSATSGLAELRQVVIKPTLSGREGLSIENALVTHGISEAIDLMADLFLCPGTPVLASDPTYLWAIRAFKLRGAVVHTIPVDENGVVPMQVARLFDYLESSGTPPPFLYVTPSHHNPTGLTMPASRRRELLEVCAQRRLLLFEDDAYADLSYESVPSSLFSNDTRDVVVYARTTSKSLAPGLRIGWILGSVEVIEALDRLKATGSCALSSAIAAEILVDPDYPAELKRINSAYKAKMDCAVEALQRSCPRTWTFSRPSGGFYIWLTSCCATDSISICQHIADQGVLCAPGAYFFANSEPYAAIRLSISHVREHEISRAIETVCEVLNAPYGESHDANSTKKG